MNFYKIQSKLSFLKKKKVALAVSGGADSMVLLHLFNSIALKLSFELYVLHYNHKWRKESIKDLKLVKDYCLKNKISFIYGETRGKIIKSEENARNERYNFFKKQALKNKLDFVCTAHHKDDQVETILFRLIRGTGPNGLLPIKEISHLVSHTVIYRPFLQFTREKIRQYAKKHHVSFIEDKTNLDLKFSRNLIRLNIVPNMKKINKNYMNNILLFCNLVYSQNIELDNYFSKMLCEIRTDNKKKEIFPVVMSRQKLVLHGNNFLVPFLYWFLSNIGVKGNLKKIDSIIYAIKNYGKLDLDSKCILEVSNDSVAFREKSQKKKIEHNSRADLKLKINIKPCKVTFDNKNVLVITPFLSKKFLTKYPLDVENRAFVDLSRFSEKSLTIRYRKPHDIFQPLGSLNALKLKNFLINKKISRDQRYELPLLCSDKEVLWVPGYALSERLRVKTIPTHKLELKKFKP